jgi:hypothetical protein
MSHTIIKGEIPAKFYTILNFKCRDCSYLKANNNGFLPAFLHNDYSGVGEVYGNSSNPSYACHKVVAIDKKLFSSFDIDPQYDGYSRCGCINGM